MAILDYGNDIKQTDQPRRKAARPPSNASTGLRAFNASDKLPPNPGGTGNMMMDCVLVKSHFPLALSPKLEKGTRWHYSDRCNVPSEGLSRSNKSAHRQTGVA